jgi:NitT/TauT family transport system substrate-binding protein
MDRHGTFDRRLFLKRMAGAGAGLLVLACQQTPAAPTAAPKAAAEPTAPAAAPAAQAAPASKTALAPMKIGLQANVLAVPTKVAVEAGVFDKYGLKVEPVKFEAAGNIVRDAIMGDQVQAGTFFVATFVVGAATGRVAAFMTSHNVARGTGVIARPDIKTVADLKGKRIGGARGTSGSQIFENKIIPANGLTKNDYTWVPLGSGGADSLGAFLAGTIDAYPSAEPYLSLGVKKGGGVLVTDYSSYDPMPIFVAGPTGFAEQNPDSVVALIKGWLDMAKFWKENPAKVMDIARAFLSGGEEQIEDDVLKTSLERLDLKPDLSREVLDPYLKETADLLLEVGNIKQVPDWSKTVRYDLWEKATKA